VAIDVGRSRVFVGDNRGFLYAFDALSGQLEWRRQLLEDGKTDIKTTPTLLPDRGLVVFGAWSGKVYALDEDTGEMVWEHPTGGSMMASTAVLPSAGIVYAASPTGKLFALDARSGQSVWTVDVGAHLYSSPAVSGDGRAVVFGAGDGNIIAVSATTGETMWRQHLGAMVTGSPTLVGNRIYVTTHKGGLWALETRDP
jgi:outer membrane protein assembly factor BamB